MLKQKYEFIGYYDLDEFVFPRTTGLIKDQQSTFTCNSISSICALTPFKNKFQANDDNYIYNYLNFLIDKDLNGREKDKLRSILFNHVAMLIPDYIEKQLMLDLGLIIERIKNSTNSTDLFPLTLYLSKPPFTHGHSFVIEKTDIELIKDLYKSYVDLIPCIYKSNLQTVAERGIQKNSIRYLYYVTEANERMGKCIHYYKNVKSLFVHYAEESTSDSWSFSPSYSDAHVLSHFREDVSEIYGRNHVGTIQKLNIDFEYIFFLLFKHDFKISISDYLIN